MLDMGWGVCIGHRKHLGRVFLLPSSCRLECPRGDTTAVGVPSESNTLAPLSLSLSLCAILPTPRLHPPIQRVCVRAAGDAMRRAANRIPTLCSMSTNSTLSTIQSSVGYTVPCCSSLLLRSVQGHARAGVLMCCSRGARARARVVIDACYNCCCLIVTIRDQLATGEHHNKAKDTWPPSYHRASSWPCLSPAPQPDTTMQARRSSSSRASGAVLQERNRVALPLALNNAGSAQQQIKTEEAGDERLQTALQTVKECVYKGPARHGKPRCCLKAEEQKLLTPPYPFSQSFHTSR